MNNRHLFSQPGTEAPLRRMAAGPDREIFRPEGEEWAILALTAERSKGGTGK